MDVTELPQGAGTGFLWDLAGHVVTNFHVVQGAERAEVPTASAPMLGRLLGASAAMRTGNATPESAANRSHGAPEQTSGTSPGWATPRACIAHTDLAYGRFIEGPRRSRSWNHMTMFAIEDAPQSCRDGVSGYRPCAARWPRRRCAQWAAGPASP